MDQKGLRAQSLKEIKGVQWIPDWGGRVSNRWSLTALTGVSPVSAQGVPMSLFVHKETHELHPRTLELMEEVAKRVEVDGIRRGGISIPATFLAMTPTATRKCRIPSTSGLTRVDPLFRG